MKPETKMMKTTPIEIVVCRYRENPYWVKRWARLFPTTVYNKGEDDFDFGEARVFKLPNVGRETQAWFEHLDRSQLLAAHWSLPPARHTFFLQADPRPHTGEDEDTLLEALVGLAAKDVPYAPVSNVQINCDADGEPHHPGLPMGLGWQQLFPDRPVPAEFLGFAGGMFVLRDDVAAAYPLEYYARLNQWCREQPLSAWVIERLWHALWQEAKEKLKIQNEKLKKENQGAAVNGDLTPGTPHLTPALS